MLFWPPRHGKSELASRLFPAYWEHRFPLQSTILGSHTAELAYSMSRSARSNFVRCGGELARDAAAVKNWETSAGGEVYAVGVGGGIHGHGANLGVIDDPYRMASEAKSPTIRKKHGEWYGADFYTRLEPRAAEVIMHTRWHENDLAGQVLDLERDPDEEPEGWTIVDFPALYDPNRDAVLAEEGERFYPDSCEVIPDFRTEVGEALCPERYDAARLRKIRGKLTAYYWAALYQQRPRPDEGTVFRRRMFTKLDALPAGKPTRSVRFWDKAGSEDKGVYTAGVLGHYYRGTDAEGTDDQLVIADVVRGQWAGGERELEIKLTIKDDGHGVVQRVEEEPGSAGKDSVRETIRRSPGYSIEGIRATGDPELRVEPLASWGETMGIYLLRDPEWNYTFIEEMINFPYGKNDDQVIAAAGCFRDLTEEPDPTVLPSWRSTHRKRRGIV